MNRKTTCLAILLAAGFSSIGALAAAAQDVNGFIVKTIPANADVLVTVPFASDSLGTFDVTGKLGGSTLQVSDPLDAGRFASVYYIRLVSAANPDAEGRWSTVTTNTASGFTLEDTSFFSEISIGDRFEVLRHATLESIFLRKFDGLSFRRSGSAFVRTFEVLLPSTAVGINNSPNLTFYFFNGSWRKVGQSPTISADNQVIEPHTYVILRNKTPQPLQFVGFGVTESSPVLTEVVPTESTDNDLPLASGRPTPSTLKQLGLGGTAAFSTSASAFLRSDELQLQQPAVPQQNNSFNVTYFFFNGEWRRVGGGVTSRDNELLPPGAGFQLRKKAGTPGTALWKQPNPSY